MDAGRRGVNPACPGLPRILASGAMAGSDKPLVERLAAALRDNLKRRKAQARAAEKPPPKPDPER